MKYFILLVLVISIAANPFEDDKKLNPIMRHFAQQYKNSFTHSMLPASSRTGETGYRNCYLSPIQCNLPVLREQTSLPILRVDSDMRRFRRMLVL